MLHEMTGQEWQDWIAYYAIKEDDHRSEQLDAKGKAALANLMLRR